MVNKIEHGILGECKVLLEVTLNNGKCFKLIETYKVKKERRDYSYKRWYRTEKVWMDAREDGRAKRPHYYALWGMAHDINSMGATKITTKGGSNPSNNKVSKYFLDLVDVSENMTFSR
jgi:hypothetical protein